MRHSILLIDDNQDLQFLHKEILEMEGYRVVIALNGYEGLEALKQSSDIDLILLDVHMDKMNGPDFLIMLEETRPDIASKIPVVFLSGTDMPSDTIAQGHIGKASNLDTFLKAIETYLPKAATF